jgi:hypothetical protein
MMSLQSVEAKYQELLAAARASGPVVLLVVELHAPSEHLAYGTYRSCRGCTGTLQGEDPSWPEDCDTTQTVARALGVVLP